ncbi:hypothetical protein KM043_018542, partial [Ampulex compressa]
MMPSDTWLKLQDGPSLIVVIL